MIVTETRAHLEAAALPPQQGEVLDSSPVRHGPRRSTRSDSTVA
jgi:hypothetical protein